MGEIAYELTADAKDSFAGGELARPDGSTLDLAEELKDGRGQIVVEENDTATIELLDTVGVLKRTKPRAASKSAKAEKEAK
jgi:hypothetical protein